MKGIENPEMAIEFFDIYWIVMYIGYTQLTPENGSFVETQVEVKGQSWRCRRRAQICGELRIFRVFTMPTLQVQCHYGLQVERIFSFSDFQPMQITFKITTGGATL